MISILDPTVIKIMTLSARDYKCISQIQLVHHKAAAPASQKRYGILMVRTCLTAASIVTSSLGPLVLRAPSSLVVKCQLTHSNAAQKSEEMFAPHRDKLTTSTFSTALGFWKGNLCNELWQEKGLPSIGRKISVAWSLSRWAAQEVVKCPCNKGKAELGLPWATMPFYYMPQAQGQMEKCNFCSQHEILDREWVDLYCSTPNESNMFHVCREREYWELMKMILHQFWWDNILPARELVYLWEGKKMQRPICQRPHRQTGLMIAKNLKLAAEAKLLCREIAGHVEFYGY
ncbi:hypothetical protein IFM89_024866 [Coptis chinensis]|uniref:Uncharacterized protein n=1 Tax=Coptis chinensis TaxID=261450 RepID=A0A835HMC1_9MAGN|nr:hypothetical protein IFM89_024866 [Coptis chinensis]